MTELVRFYGYDPNRSGFIRCPFHPDRTASLKIYSNGRGWYCFGCHKGGSIIDFVMEDFGVSFPDACKKINTDFALGLSNEKPTKIDRALSIMRKDKAVQEMRRKRDAELARIALELEERDGIY